MAQVTKFTIDPNLSGIQLRTQASEMLTALSTLNSGDLEPVNPTGGMLWLDTTNNILKIRDKTNTAWLDFAKVNNNVLAANATDNSTPNTLVSRNADGDFKARRVTAGNFLTTEKAQDDAIDENSEICYRAAQSSESEPKQMRFATIKKIKTALEVDQKLGKNDKAADSAKLGGIEGGNFHRKDGANGSKITTITSLEVDLTQGDNFVLNLSSPGKLTLKNGTVGQSGALIVRNATNITGYDAALGFRVVPTGLKATEVFAYFVVSENEIKIGRV